jgi:signal peptidase I
MGKEVSGMGTSTRSPVVIFVATGVSVLALVAAWLAPVVGLVLAAVVVLGGIVIFAIGSRAVGAVVCVMPFAVAIFGLQIAGLFLVKAYRVPSESMAPTIAIGDRVLVSRHAGRPSIGDVVIAQPPAGALDDRCGARKPEDAPCARGTSALSDVKYVKRVVAGPGDTVAIRRGLVIRNGKLVREPYARQCGDRDLCELPRAITVPADAWFLLGDNRGASDDSRIWGPVPTRAILGSVELRYWPPKSAKRF